LLLYGNLNKCYGATPNTGTGTGVSQTTGGTGSDNNSNSGTDRIDNGRGLDLAVIAMIIVGSIVLLALIFVIVAMAVPGLRDTIFRRKRVDHNSINNDKIEMK